MVDARSAYLAKKNTPAVGSYGGGEDFGSPFGGGSNQPPGSSNEASVPYGGTPPPSSGGGGDNNNNNLDNFVLAPPSETGSGASGGQKVPFFGVGLDTFGNITGSNIGQGGMDNVFNLMEDAPATGFNDYYNNLQLGESGNVNTGFNIEGLSGPKTGLDLNPIGGVGYTGDNFSFGLDVDPNLNLGNMSVNPTFDAKFKYQFNEGGPVIDQSGIMSIYDYADGGQVMPATSYMDPTADDYFLRELGQYLKRFLPNYDPEQDEYRHKKNREKSKAEIIHEEVMKKNKPVEYAAGGPIEITEEMTMKEMGDRQMGEQGATQSPMSPPPMTKPFGATRENVAEQLEAYRNAPVHVDPPNIGFFGEQIPAPLFDRAMKYLEGLEPSERAVVEEMIRGTIQQKQMQEMQEAEDMMKSAIPTMGA
jgi:hypothetical protein